MVMISCLLEDVVGVAGNIDGGRVGGAVGAAGVLCIGISVLFQETIWPRRARGESAEPGSDCRKDDSARRPQ